MTDSRSAWSFQAVGLLGVAAAGLLPFVAALSASQTLSHLALPASFWGFDGGLFMPLTWLSRGLGHEWLLNALLHAIASGLVAWSALSLGLLLGARRPRTASACALAAGALFAAGPLRADLILSDAGRPAILSTIFALACLLSYLRYRDEPEGRAWLWGSLIAYLLACLSWTGAVALPLALAALDHWRPGRAGRARWPNLLAAPNWAAVTFAMIAYLALVYAMNGHYLAAPPRLPHWSAGFELPRLAAGLGQAAGQLLLPHRAERLAPYLPGAGADVLAGAALILVLPLAVWRYRGPGVWLAACLALYAGAFFAAWDPAVLMAQTDAPRAAYLPTAFLLVAAPALAPWLEGASRNARRAAAAAAVLLLVLSAIGSLEAALALRRGALDLAQSQWQATSRAVDALTRAGALNAEDAQALVGAAPAAGGDVALGFLREAVSLDPNNWLAHLNLALTLNAAGRGDEALEQMSAAVRANPSAVVARNDLGYFLMQRGRLPEAIEQLKEAVRLDPNMALAQNNLAAAQAAQTGETPPAERARRAQALLSEGAQAGSRGRLAEAIDKLSQAGLLDPGNSAIAFDLGVIYVQAGRLGEAEAAFRRAISLQPSSAQAHFNLGFCLHQQGRLDEAVVEYREAIRYDPRAANAYLNAGVALTAQNKLAEADQFCSQAARLDPGAANNSHCYRRH